jgi:hypothetical protein
VKGTRREGSLAGGQVEKVLEMGMSFIGAPLENLKGGLSTREFER